MQDAVKSKTATVLAIDAARSRHPSMAYCDQNVVLQTPEEDRCPPVPGENPLIDLLQRYPTVPVPFLTRIPACLACLLPCCSAKHVAVSVQRSLHNVKEMKIQITRFGAAVQADQACFQPAHASAAAMLCAAHGPIVYSLLQACDNM